MIIWVYQIALFIIETDTSIRLNGLVEGPYVISLLSRGAIPHVDLLDEMTGESIRIERHSATAQMPGGSFIFTDSETPILSFEIDHPGTYVLDLQGMSGAVKLAPDTARMNERILLISVLIHGLIALILIGSIWRWWTRRRSLRHPADQEIANQRPDLLNVFESGDSDSDE